MVILRRSLFFHLVLNTVFSSSLPLGPRVFAFSTSLSGFQTTPAKGTHHNKFSKWHLLILVYLCSKDGIAITYAECQSYFFFSAITLGNKYQCTMIDLL